ncbi:MurR/RpiR family transcriptional regulator [Breznakia pachnodae]|uniref:DNA-binding MurR/RpiR family transcriptional regulator n=1 Tax=Breznakia pachnodae TaxID=265178 RepID=A0ABU0E3M7_9FIRM|nr:MurR/RpiR family transcriptional regulator [Breznakia pachnodae]MDQ0361436.1 DNA-binding MurR/RpiR family transcriptional regulator [Breznakia pachnodae]
MNSLLIKLEALLPHLTNAEAKVANYILLYRENILSMSIKELAKDCEVSEPTVVRLCRELGLKGYSDFKIELAKSLTPNMEVNSIDDISQYDSSLAIFQKVSETTIQSIKNTCETLNNDDFDKAIDLIRTAHENKKNIYIVAVGASSVIATDLQIKFMRLNIPTIFYQDFHLSLESITNITEDDLLIVFSTLGKSVHAHHCLQIANEKNAKSIIITQYGNEITNKHSTVTLLTTNIENNLRLASQTSLILQMLIVDSIFIKLALDNLEEIQKDVNDTKKLFSEFKYYQ